MHIHFLRLEYENNEISQPAKDYLSINLGWAVGTALGVWVSGGISGGHINPAVSYLSYAYLNSLTFLLDYSGNGHFQRVSLEKSTRKSVCLFCSFS